MWVVREYGSLDSCLSSIAKKIFLYLSSGPDPKVPYRNRRYGYSRMGVNNFSVDIFLLSGKDMRALEKKMGMPVHHAPNVLSFAEPEDFPHPETRKVLLGEIYLNKDLGARGFNELAHLLVHGILHLIGYSHEQKNDILIMESLEREICKKVLRGKKEANNF